MLQSLVDKYIVGKELEIDAIADGEERICSRCHGAY